MLQRIIIKNYALIESLEIDLHSGLNVITGETGAGKSIIIDAITLLLGQRGNKENIRVGTDKMTVQGEFDISDQKDLSALLQSMDIEIKDNELLISRSIDVRGKNNCRINGIMVTVAQLKSVGDRLVDIHSQHEHNSLFQIETHRDLLDAFGGEAAGKLRTCLAEDSAALKTLREKIRTTDQDSKTIDRQKDMLRFQLNEIEQAALISGEEEQLEREKNIMVNAEKLHNEAAKAYQILNGSENMEEAGVLSEAATLSESLSRLSQIDTHFREFDNTLERAVSDLKNIADDLSRYLDRMHFDTGALDTAEKRLSLISGLKRKYGQTVDEVIAYGEKCRHQLEQLANHHHEIDQMKKDYLQLWNAYKANARTLYELRLETTKTLAQQLEKELKDLAMQKARVQINIDHNDNRISTTGQDHVEFLISLNPGITPKPIQKVASGGEMSRIMLALKCLFSRLDPIGTMIFDEIDTGISGRTAQVVAEKIEGLSREHQIICITHLPQIAAMGDRQFRVVKNVDKEQTEVNFKTLSEDERAEELARMISGAETTQTTLNSAKEMIEMSARIKTRH